MLAAILEKASNFKFKVRQTFCSAFLQSHTPKHSIHTLYARMTGEFRCLLVLTGWMLVVLQSFFFPVYRTWGMTHTLVSPLCRNVAGIGQKNKNQLFGYH